MSKNKFFSFVSMRICVKKRTQDHLKLQWHQVDGDHFRSQLDLQIMLHIYLCSVLIKTASLSVQTRKKVQRSPRSPTLGPRGCPCAASTACPPGALPSRNHKSGTQTDPNGPEPLRCHPAPTCWEWWKIPGHRLHTAASAESCLIIRWAEPSK